MKKMMQYITTFLLTGSLLASGAYAETNVSFVQMGHVAEFKLMDAKTNTYELTLKKANPYVTYISDRPARIIGQLTNQAFLAKWNVGKDSFQQDAPNAVLNGAIRAAGQKKQFVNIAVELSAPVYHADTQRFSYRVHLINSATKQVPAEKLYYAVLFIDNACLSCVGK